MFDCLIQLINGYIYHILAITVVLYLIACYVFYQRGGLPEQKDVYQVDENDIVEIHGPETCED